MDYSQIDGNTAALNQYMREQDALEIRQEYIDARVEDRLEDADEVMDVIADLDDDSVLEILTALQMGTTIKVKRNWRTVELKPAAVLDNYVRDCLEKRVKEEME